MRRLVIETRKRQTPILRLTWTEDGVAIDHVEPRMRAFIEECVEHGLSRWSQGAEFSAVTAPTERRFVEDLASYLVRQFKNFEARITDRTDGRADTYEQGSNLGPPMLRYDAAQAPVDMPDGPRIVLDAGTARVPKRVGIQNYSSADAAEAAAPAA